MAYQIDGDDEQNRMQVKFLSLGQTGDLEVRSKGQISPCQFQRFLYQTLCVFSQMNDTKHIRRDFYYVAWVKPQGVGLRGAGGAQGVQFFFQTWSSDISN